MECLLIIDQSVHCQIIIQVKRRFAGPASSACLSAQPASGHTTPRPGQLAYQLRRILCPGGHDARIFNAPRACTRAEVSFTSRAVAAKASCEPPAGPARPPPNVADWQGPGELLLRSGYPSWVTRRNAAPQPTGEYCMHQRHRSYPVSIFFFGPSNSQVNVLDR